MTANTGNVALRVPNAKIPLAVVTAAAIPITATSANLSGASECTSAEQVRDQLQGRISIIVDGGYSPRDVASTIIDLSDEIGALARDSRRRDSAADEISNFFAQRMTDAPSNQPRITRWWVRLLICCWPCSSVAG